MKLRRQNKTWFLNKNHKKLKDAFQSLLANSNPKIKSEKILKKGIMITKKVCKNLN